MSFSSKPAANSRDDKEDSEPWFLSPLFVASTAIVTSGVVTYFVVRSEDPKMVVADLIASLKDNPYFGGKGS